MKERLIFDIQPYARKHLLFLDEEGAAAISAIEEFISKIKGKYELNIIGHLHDEVIESLRNSRLTCNEIWNDCESAPLLDYLKSQRIGTKLYISASWGTARKLETAAEIAGYAPEEIQIHPHGPKFQHVFCVSCYTIHPINERKVIVCNNCRKIISVSNHYSRRLNAVLGYLVLQERKAEP